MRVRRVFEKFQDVTGIETSAQTARLRRRLAILGETVQMDTFDQRFQVMLEKEARLLDGEGGPDWLSSLGTMVKAEERLRIRALCVAGCALPGSGVKAPELREMGFDTGPLCLERRYGFGNILRIVGFPDGWDISADHLDGGDDTYATVCDASGTPQLSVYYQHSFLNNFISGHTRLAKEMPQALQTP